MFHAARCLQVQMFKFKFFIAALAVAPCACSGPAGEQGVVASAFLVSSALVVAIVVGSRPPWVVGVVDFGAGSWSIYRYM